MVLQNLIQIRAVVVIGPTASGKTALAHSLCDRFRAQHQPCELVNLDAFQFYKGVTAGTAKPTPAEQAHYCYHGIGMLEPDARFDAQSYAVWAHRTCGEIISRGAVPLCVGGSGLYLRAFLHGLDPLPGKDDAVRAFLRLCASTWGNARLHKWLSAVDFVRAQELHVNDKTRVERALELYLLTGKPPSFLRSKTSVLLEQNSLLSCYLIHVDKNDDKLRKDIRDRVPHLFALNFLDEVNTLRNLLNSSEQESWQSLQAIGYPEVAAFLETFGLEQALALAASQAPAFAELKQQIATRTWQYVRRQRTWNKKEKCDARFETGTDSMEVVFERASAFWNERAVPTSPKL